MSRIKVFDNGGDAFDRYTVVVNRNVYTMSMHPHSPQGYNQYAGTTDEIGISERLGKPISFQELPQEVQEAILERK